MVWYMKVALYIGFGELWWFGEAKGKISKNKGFHCMKAKEDRAAFVEDREGEKPHNCGIYYQGSGF